MRTRSAWTPEEIERLKATYEVLPLADLLESFKPHPRRSVICKGLELGLRRFKPGRSEDEVRAAKRAWMAKARQNPEVATRWNAQNRLYHAERRAPKQKANRERIRQTRFFYYRAMILHGKQEPITAKMLAKMWRDQRGRCALSGRKLGRDAHLDHKMPLSRGGQTMLSNLHWVSPEVNYAKRDLTVDEFQMVCEEVARWIASRMRTALEAAS